MEPEVLAERIENMADRFDKLEATLITFMDKTDARIRALEDWKLVFVTKFTVYSTIALFCGSVIAQVGIYYINNFMLK